MKTNEIGEYICFMNSSVEVLLQDKKMWCDSNDLREVKVMKVYFLYPRVCLCDIAYLCSGRNSLELNSVENSIDLL